MRSRRWASRACLLVGAVVGLATLGTQVTAQAPPRVPDVVLVGLKPSSLVADGVRLAGGATVAGDALAAQLGGVAADPLIARGATPRVSAALTADGLATGDLSSVVRLRLRAGESVDAAVARLRTHPLVAYVEPDYLAHVLATPTDPLYGDQWGLQKIEAPAAWDVTTGSPTVPIAVIDSGLDVSHPDLAPQLWRNPGEVAGNGLDDDGNGYVDDLHGWNVFGNNADLSDTTGHGTEVAGIVAAATNNAVGGAGVCRGCRVMVVKVAQAGGTANYSDIAAGVVYAAQKGARVINLSLGGISDSVTLRTAIALAAQTAVVVGGAGNGNATTKIYPAAYDEHVIAVAGTGRTDVKVGTSNYGPWVDLTGPGEEITTTFSGGTWGVTSGTSMAAPFVAGVAGLVRSAQPGWSATSARQQLLNTADNIDAANAALGAGQLGAGRVNARRALTTAAAPVLAVAGTSVTGVTGGAVKLGVAVPVVVTLKNTGIDAASVTATLSSADPAVTIGKATAAFGTVAGGATGSNAADAFQITVATGSGFGRTVAFTLTGTADGAPFSLPVTLTSEATTLTLGTLTTIATDTTWTNDRVYVANNVIVEQGATLTIQPGTVVRFNPGRAMIVRGTLVAKGTRTSPILLTSSKDSPQPSDYWGSSGGMSVVALTFEDTAIDAVLDADLEHVSGSVLQFVTVEYGSGISLQNATPLIADCVIRKMGIAPLSSSQWGVPTGPGTPGSPPSRVHILRNRFSDNSGPLSVTAAVVRGNLFERNSGGLIAGMQAGEAPRIEHNTFVETGSGQTATISVQSAGVVVTGNTFVPKDVAPSSMPGLPQAATDIAVSSMGVGAFILDASSNFWGTTDRASIEARIRDGADDLTNLGIVKFDPVLGEPSPDAPAIAKGLTLSPQSPVGIQTVTFRATFSGPMDPAVEPEFEFETALRGTWSTFTSANAPIPTGNFYSTATDREGRTWVVAQEGLFRFDGSTWTHFPPSTPGLAPVCEPGIPFGCLGAIVVDAAGTLWFGGLRGVVSYDGVSWRPAPPGGPPVGLFADARPGSPDAWFVSTNSAYRLRDGQWLRVELPAQAFDVATGPQGDAWFALVNEGLARYDGQSVSRFMTQHEANKRGVQVAGFLPEAACTSAGFDNKCGQKVTRVAVDESGRVFVGTDVGLVMLADGSPSVIVDAIDTPEWGGVASLPSGGVVAMRRFRGTFWVVKNNVVTAEEFPILPGVSVDDAYADERGIWIVGVGYVSRRNGGQQYRTHAPGRWLDDRTYEATYEFTSLIPRGDYVLTVSGARDQLGFDTPAARTTFTVDYAGTITDRTPPAAPVMIAAGRTGNAGAVEARWAAATTTGVLPATGAPVRAAATDPSVTGYRYAIGTAAGATDVVNWTDTTATSVSLTGLGLIPGQQYYLALQARNAGGLWSPSTISPFIAGTGFLTAYLAEGATGDFFDLDIAIANPQPAPVSAFVTFLSDGGAGETLTYTVPAQGRITVRADQVAAVAATAVSTVVESSHPLIVERTMFWDEQAQNYGGHGGNAVSAPSPTWYFAEGSQGFFDTWVLLANPGDTDTTATVTFLLDNGPPLVDTVAVPAHRRATVFAGTYERLRNTSFAITVAADQPILAERAMYFGGPPRWRGGHESPGTTAPATRWSLVEGATGDYFDTYVLVGNPNDTPVDLTFTFLLGTPYEGTTYVLRDTLGAKQRYTLNPETLARPGAYQLLAATAVSTIVEASAPVVVERAMYWPGNFTTWAEAHNSLGVTETGARWGLSEGRIGGTAGFETYLLLANAHPTLAAEVRLTFLREQGAPIVITRQVPAASRNNVYVNSAAEVPGLAPGERFGVLIESQPVAGAPEGVPISVERAMYWNAGAEHWAGGTNALATKLR